MMKMIAAIVLSVVAALVAVPANAVGEQPTGTLQAWAVQPDQDRCKPGFIQVVASEGVDHWVIEGTEHPAPADGFARFEFPAGIQADVYAVPSEGYDTGNVKGSEAHPFMLQVDPLGCDYQPPTCDTDPETTRLIEMLKGREVTYRRTIHYQNVRIDAQARTIQRKVEKIQRKNDRIQRLRDKVRDLRNR